MATDPKTRLICPECGADYTDGREQCPNDGATLERLGLADAEEADPLVGEVLDDRFEIHSIIGEGGMGKVYRGAQTSVEREVAIKVIHAKHCHDETAVKRFFREARVISKFSHPNIVNLIDFGRDEASDVLYFVMELIDGVPVGEISGEDRFGPAPVIEIGKQTCEALSEPHSHGVVHRDLKPDNLMLVPISDGRLQVKLVDFGVAQAMQDKTDLTETGATCGTPPYMAPEQAKGTEIGPHTDVYALGVVLYELLGGKRPFDGESSMEVMFKHIEEQPARLGRDVPLHHNVPKELVAVVEGMLVKSPQERPDDVLEIREDFESIEDALDLERIRVQPGATPDDIQNAATGSGTETTWPDLPAAGEPPDTGAPTALYETDEQRESADGAPFEPETGAESAAGPATTSAETFSTKTLVALTAALAAVLGLLAAVGYSVFRGGDDPAGSGAAASEHGVDAADRRAKRSRDTGSGSVAEQTDSGAVARTRSGGPAGDAASARGETQSSSTGARAEGESDAGNATLGARSPEEDDDSASKDRERTGGPGRRGTAETNPESGEPESADPADDPSAKTDGARSGATQTASESNESEESTGENDGENADEEPSDEGSEEEDSDLDVFMVD